MQTTDANKPKFKLGDRKYYIPGYRAHQLICILCTIVEVEDAPGGYYWLDEPIGHGVGEKDLLFQDEAVIELMARYRDELEEGCSPEDNLIIPNANLIGFRKESISFIESTWERAGCEGKPQFKHLRDKEPWDEWFNPQMVFDKRKGVIRAAAVRYKGEVYWEEAPMRHNHAIAAASEATGDFFIRDEEQGFILQDETFVDRLEAASIALESGQINKLSSPPQLYSEDLW